MIRNAVIHPHNDQPLIADLFALPTASDACLVCTNLRGLDGRRPVFADHSDSLFLFPLVHVRFVELPPDALEAAGTALPSGRAVRQEPEPEAAPPEPEVDLEIDEDFLRRVREA